VNNELQLLQFGYFRIADLYYSTTDIINNRETMKMQGRLSLNISLL